MDTASARKSSSSLLPSTLAYSMTGCGSGNAASSVCAGNDDALDVFDDIAAGANLHALRQHTEYGTRLGGAIGYGDRLGAAHGADQLSTKTLYIGLIDM